MKILLVAGGSGGHLVPALALADRLKSAGAVCWMLSTRRPVDRILASWAGQEWRAVGLERLTPAWRWLSPSYLLRQARAVREIGSVLQSLRPDVVVAFGGYLSAVAILAARGSGIPTVLHEQNVLPGRANRWLAPFSHAVAVSFPQTSSHLRGRMRVEWTGNPIRFHPNGGSREEICRGLGLDPLRPVLLVMGGSQGSRAINQLVLSMWEGLSESERQRLQVLHLAGGSDASAVETRYARLKMQARVFPFLYEMDRALSVSTLAVSRAGATGISEMVAFQLPALLIPYPYAAVHQAENAEWMRSIGGAVVLPEKGLTPQKLWQEILGLLEAPGALGRMRRALAVRRDPSAADRLANLVQEVAGGAA